ncbi:hypothetical protein JW979_00120 [bacterium]|nr:hypothetical protein [candidate division CSSED10-310 bacterium]
MSATHLPVFCVECRSEISGTVRTFFKSHEPFHRDNSKTAFIKASDSFEILKFPLPNINIHTVRFDPINNDSTLFIKRIWLETDSGNQLSSVELSSVKPVKDIRNIKIENNLLVIKPIPGADDPQTIIHLPCPLTDSQPKPLNLLRVAIYAIMGCISLFLLTILFRSLKNLSRDRWIHLLKKSLFTLILLLILLGICELGLIIAEPYLFHSFYEYDPDIGFRVKAYAEGSNRFGFNDRDYPLKKLENRFRVLILGDSFGWSGGIDTNYTARLEYRFREYYGDHRVEIINAGYPMTHTAEQFEILKKYGLQYHPDMVVVGFFCGNDFIDADPFRKRIVVNGVFFDIDTRHEHSLLGYPIVMQSRLYAFLKQEWIILKEWLATKRESPPPPKKIPEDETPAFSNETYLQIEKNRFEFCNLGRHNRGEFDGNIEVIFTAFLEIQDLTQKNAAALAVALYPDEFQVNSQLRRDIIRTYHLNASDYDLDLMQNLLSDFLKSKHIPYIDLLPQFRAKSASKNLYIPRNTHWNTQGSALAADLLFDYLKPYADDYFQKHGRVQKTLLETNIDQ